MIDHRRGAAAMANFFNVRGVGSAAGGRVGREDFPEDMGLGWMDVHLSDHAGNHIDAPWHFGPLVEGRSAKTIDEVPMKLRGGSAGWVRPVAMVPESHFSAGPGGQTGDAR